MGIYEALNTTAAWGHLDGMLVYPLNIDGIHVLMTEDGHALLIPRDMLVPFAGRIGVSSDGVPCIDPLNVDSDDILKITAWGAALQSDTVTAAVRDVITQTLAQVEDPSVYLHDPERNQDQDV